MEENVNDQSQGASQSSSNEGTNALLTSGPNSGHAGYPQLGVVPHNHDPTSSYHSEEPRFGPNLSAAPTQTQVETIGLQNQTAGEPQEDTVNGNEDAVPNLYRFSTPITTRTPTQSFDSLDPSLNAITHDPGEQLWLLHEFNRRLEQLDRFHQALIRHHSGGTFSRMQLVLQFVENYRQDNDTLPMIITQNTTSTRSNAAPQWVYCGLCPSGAKTVEKLAAHLFSAHTLEVTGQSENWFSCKFPKCLASFKRREDLDRHVKHTHAFIEGTSRSHPVEVTNEPEAQPIPGTHLAPPVIDEAIPTTVDPPEDEHPPESSQQQGLEHKGKKKKREPKSKSKKSGIRKLSSDIVSKVKLKVGPAADRAKKILGFKVAKYRMDVDEQLDPHPAPADHENDQTHHDDPPTIPAPPVLNEGAPMSPPPPPHLIPSFDWENRPPPSAWDGGSLDPAHRRPSVPSTSFQMGLHEDYGMFFTPLSDNADNSHALGAHNQLNTFQGGAPAGGNVHFMAPDQVDEGHPFASNRSITSPTHFQPNIASPFLQPLSLLTFPVGDQQIYSWDSLPQTMPFAHNQPSHFPPSFPPPPFPPPPNVQQTFLGHPPFTPTNPIGNIPSQYSHLRWDQQYGDQTYGSPSGASISYSPPPTARPHHHDQHQTQNLFHFPPQQFVPHQQPPVQPPGRHVHFDPNIHLHQGTRPADDPSTSTSPTPIFSPTQTSHPGIDPNHGQPPYCGSDDPTSGGQSASDTNQFGNPWTGHDRFRES
ncbi:hypothetical protein FS842_011478 [Serendipita sp. 407]|nr:hypothetical protein FS842_011478 [Serendipita sp. 407]